MDRIAISKRLEGLSTVFSNDTKISSDLRAMSYVLANMPDEKFSAILNPSFTPDAPVEAAMPLTVGLGGGPRGLSDRPNRSQDRTRNQVGPGKDMDDAAFDRIVNKIVSWAEGDKKRKVLDKVEEIKAIIKPAVLEDVKAPVMAGEKEEVVEGSYWNKEASAQVVNNLVKSVVGMNKVQIKDTGRKLTPNETPDGKHTGVPETPATLKEDQTPNQVDVLDSDMVKKTNGPVKKEAADEKDAGQNAPGGNQNNPNRSADELLGGKKKEAGIEEIKEQKVEKAEEQADKMQEKAKENVEKAQKGLEKAEEKKDVVKKVEKEVKEASVDTASISVAGIELYTPMEEVTLNASEAEELNKLFM